MRLSTRLTVAMVALVLFTATTVGLLALHNITALAQPRFLDRLDTHAQLLAIKLELSVRGARGDVLGFRAANTVIDIMTARLNNAIDPAAGAAEAEGRRRLAFRLAAELTSKSNYYEFRIIGVDDDGREIVRVDRSGPGGTVRTVPDSELERKGDRDFFKTTIDLPAGEVYVSRINFNRDDGTFETPRVPVLRVATPLHTPAGRPFGIVIIDVDMRPAFAEARASEHAGGSISVVNDRGDYLVHPDRNREFAFELGPPIRVQDDFPEMVEILQQDDTPPRVVRDRVGERFGMGWEKVRLAGGPEVAVIETLPYSKLVAAAVAARDSSLLGGLAAVLGGFALAVLLARSLTRPLVQMARAVEGFARDESMAVPTRAGGEIGVLARAFARMADNVREKTSVLNRAIDERTLADEKFRLAVEASPSGLVMIDGNGAIVLVNAETERLFGYRREELIGRPVDILVPPGSRGRHGGHRLLFAAQPEARPMGADRNLRGLRKDGTEFPIEVGLNPIHTNEGILVLSVIVDMTAKKKAQVALLESEQMARGIIADSLDAFIQLNEVDDVIEWNPQAVAVFGWSRQEAVGKPLTSLFLPKEFQPRYLDVKARLQDVDKNVSAGERFEIEAVRKSGQKINIEVSLNALRRRSGYVFNSFVRDLTEKRAAEEQLRQALKMEAVGQLTGGIAHDFNNILTVITGSVEFLEESVADKPELVGIAKLIGEAADRGAELTGHMLAFARKQPLQPRETDVNALMVESGKLLRPTLGAHIEIETALEEAAWLALVDPTQLTTALLNLAVNARDAMPNGGKLTLETGNVILDESYADANREVKPGSYVMVAVSDTGTGIPAAVRDRVFEPFFTTKEAGKGTGLGLSMVYGFVKQSGGHIKIYSEEGHGTTIKIYLPRAGAQWAQAAATAPAPHIEGGNEMILVVEDDALVRTSVTAQLQSLGYQTISAANAADALLIVDGGAAFDLLFTDIIMPGPMNGRQLADETAKRRLGVKVLYTSGYTEDAVIHHGRLDPGVLLLGKPYRKSDLARMLRTALNAAATMPSNRLDTRSAQAR
jgi:PAS domain S-box-containing protein